MGHGTACAGIIRSVAPDVELLSIRIFDESLQVRGSLLLDAISWAIDEKVHLLNLSLGTTNPNLKDPLTDAVKLAVTSGILVVAADGDEPGRSYPACLEDVIGVGGSAEIAVGAVYRREKPVELFAYSGPRRVCWPMGQWRIKGGTSFAAAYVTGQIACNLEAHQTCGLTPRGVVKIFQPFSEDTSSRPAIEAAPFETDRACLYPYNKEMHSLIRYRDLLPFDISAVVDYPAKRLVGKDAGEAIGIDQIGVKISAKLDSSLELSDSLILGHLNELSRNRGQDLLESTISKAIHQGKNVFSLSPIPKQDYPHIYDLAREAKVQIASPWISDEDIVDYIRATRELPPVTVPVVGVLGTSSSQGKFTFQLGLRVQLQRAGHRISQLGTEPHSSLFGFEGCIAAGYDGLQMPPDVLSSYVDSMLRRLAMSSPDLILVGAQSGTVPYDINSERTHTLGTLAFLLGARPDVVILVVNSIDPDEYIEDTIATIRGVSRAKTVALALSDRGKHIRQTYGRTMITPEPISKEVLEQVSQKLEDRFSLPLLRISSEFDQRRAVTIIENCLASE